MSDTTSARFILYPEEDITRLLQDAVREIKLGDETLKKELCQLMSRKLRESHQSKYVGFCSVYKCQECKYGSFTEAELKLHMRMHEHVLNCMYCSYTAEDPTGLHRHILMHTAVTPHMCYKCHYVAISSAILSEHERLAHQTQFTFQCKCCGFHANGGEYLELLHGYLHTHCQQKVFKGENLNASMCSSANAEYLESYAMDSSVSPDNDRAEVDEPFKSPAADARAPWWNTSADQYFSSMYGKEMSELVEVQCDICGQFYPVIGHSHQCDAKKPRSVWSVVAANKPFHAKQMKSLFEVKDEYSQSTDSEKDADESNVAASKISKDDPENLNTCSHCNFSSLNPTEFNKHLTAHHQNKIMSCPHCDYCTHSNDRMSQHLRAHTGYKPHLCWMCGRTFSTSSDFRKHERIHSGVNEKVSCDICGKSYSHVKTLVIHKRTHTGIRPYKCTVCDYAATSKTLLNGHMAVHTGEKKYKCDMCDFTCAANGTLHHHKRLKHKYKNKPKISDITPESFKAAKRDKEEN